MKTKTVYVTFDNVEHADYNKAKRHLEILHSNKLSKLAAQLVAIDKHIAMGNFVDANLHMFAELQRIKDDMHLLVEPEDNEEE